MSWSKKAIVSYHFIEAGKDDYFNELKLSFNSLLKSGDTSGTFDAGQSHFYWKINSKIDLSETNTFFISVVREKSQWPVWFREEEGIEEIPLDDGALGELHYGIINPEKRFILSMAATGGGPTSAFRNFLNEFSKDGSVKLTPLFEDKIDMLTLSWEYYKKISLSFNFPSYEHQAEFMTTKEGSLMGLIDELGGLKADVTISAPKQNQNLNSSQIKEIAKTFLVNDFCSKLILRGSGGNGEEVDEFDLKNAQVKYKEIVEISGSYMVENEALPILKRAFNDRSSDLMHLF